jgi:hypothetical protein
MSHYPYTNPRLSNSPVHQWADWLEDGSWSEEYVDLVPTLLIDNNAWNPQRLQSLEEGYAKGAKFLPVQLSRRGGKYMVGDGNHRVELSKIHGLTHVPAILVRIHDEQPPGQPPRELAREISGRELGKLLAILRRKDPLQAQYGFKSTSRDGKVWLILVSIEDRDRYVDGLVAVKKSGNGYTILAKWNDDKSPSRFSAHDYDSIANTVWGWIESRENQTMRVAKEILTVAHDLLAAENGLSDETITSLAVESRNLHSVPFQKAMKEPIGILGGKTVYAVDGDEIKVKHTMDFVEGGNGMVYDFVPRDELWVDARIKSQDWPHIAFHEAVESLLMEEYGLGYDEAHARANALEVGEIKRVASDGILRVAHDLLASD